jgi:hypothetical protein
VMQRMGTEGEPGRSIATHGSCRYHEGSESARAEKPPVAHPLCHKIGQFPGSTAQNLLVCCQACPAYDQVATPLWRPAWSLQALAAFTLHRAMAARHPLCAAHLPLLRFNLAVVSDTCAEAPEPTQACLIAALKVVCRKGGWLGRMMNDRG